MQLFALLRLPPPLLVFPPLWRRIVVVAVRVAFPGVGIGFVLRFFEQAIWCVEIVLLRFFNVVNQCAHQFAHQRAIEVKAFVDQRFVNFLQGMLMQVVGDIDGQPFNARLDLKLFNLGEEGCRFRHLPDRKFGKDDAPLLAHGRRLVKCCGRSFHVSCPRLVLLHALHDLHALEQVERLIQLVVFL